MTETARPANPMGTDGFEFIEYTAPDPRLLGGLFEQLGFSAVARHRSKDVVLYRQGGINFIVNREPDSFAQSFARVHGPSACAFAIRVKDAARAYERALALALRQGDEVQVVETFGTGEAFLVEFHGKAKAKADQCEWMGVLYPTEIEVVGTTAEKR